MSKFNPKDFIFSKENIEQKNYIKKIEELSAKLFQFAIHENLKVGELRDVCSFLQTRLEIEFNKKEVDTLLGDKYASA